jgi:uncharacterized protein (TIGR02246 family)
MKKSALIVFVIFWGCSPKTSEESAIRELLMRQQAAWNKGNVEEFMEGYWKSDSLMFIGSKITYGWDSTLARYHRTYPNTDAMGKLDFTFYDFKFLGDDACLVTGKYHLKRTSDDPSGMFTLLLRRKEGKWLIVYDHTS